MALRMGSLSCMPTDLATANSACKYDVEGQGVTAFRTGPLGVPFQNVAPLSVPQSRRKRGMTPAMLRPSRTLQPAGSQGQAPWSTAYGPPSCPTESLVRSHSSTPLRCYLPSGPRHQRDLFCCTGRLPGGDPGCYPRT